MELRATRMVAGGSALARAADGRVALVEGALPDELVRVDVTADRADHLRARTVAVIEPSPARVEMPCPHARDGCGGCGWQHIAIAAQRTFKQDIVRDALRRIAHVDDPPLVETVALPATGYRSTVRTLVVDGRPAFRRAHSHDPISIASCLVAHPLVDEVLTTGRFGAAHEITVRAGLRTGERCIVVEPASESVEVANDVRQGSRAHIHETVLGQRFRISARSFFQIRPDGADALAHLVRDAVGADRSVVDLYSGVGLFSALLASPRRVTAVEWNRNAVRDARVNLASTPTRVVRADVGRWRGAPADVVIADPSRTGLHKEGARTVLACDPERVVLVSCDVAALGRDVKLLADAGFALTSVTPVDLFPHTPHVECVTVFDVR
jgi:23S rRNA (uracil1939-C5)-methyltransferase